MFRKSFSLLTIIAISAAPVAVVVSCGTSEPEALNMDKAVVAENTDSNPFKINNLPFGDGSFLFNKNELIKLQKELKERLYYGPEAWDLKDITLDSGHIASGSQLGVYYPKSKQIFINIKDLEGLSYDEASDVIIKVLAHEYGHHFFATYANGYKSKKDNAVMNDGNYVYDNSGNPLYFSSWNKEYYSEFIKLYNMNNDEHIDELPYHEDNIDTVFSLKELFDNANKKGGTAHWDDKWRNHDKVSFASSNTAKVLGSTSGYIVSVGRDNKDSLKYIYSIDEQSTRKMQMMFYPYEIPHSRYSFDVSLLKTSADENKSFFDPYAVDWLRTSELYRTRDEIIKKSIYKDDIFQNENGVSEAYSALLKLMGYGKSISHMYSKNTAKVANATTVVGMTSSNNNKVRISGYIDPSKKIKYIVDEEGKIIAELEVSQKRGNLFHFKHKATWNQDIDAPLVGPDYDQQKVAYMSEEFDIANYVGKKLFFSYGKDDELRKTNKTSISDINENSDKTTNINSYDSHRPEKDKYYKLVVKNNNVEVEEY